MLHMTGSQSARPLSAISRRDSSQSLFLLFAAEGAFLQFITSVNSFGNNLFATALGATDSQIGLVQTVPNVAAVLLLLPLGMLADRLRSSRTIPLISLLCIAAGFFTMSLVPAFGSFAMPAFFLSLVFTVGGPVIYNAQWQNFFGDVVDDAQRNPALTRRNRYMFAVGIAAPLFCSAVMTTFRGGMNGLGMFRLFFLMCGCAMLAQAAVVFSIPAPVHTALPAKASQSTWKPLLRSRKFLLFFLPITFFHMSWQADWSMWYIGQVQYLHLTEAQITSFSGLFNIGQLAALGILSRQVQKKGTDRVLPLAALGLISCPLIMIVCSLLPQAARMPVFTVLVTVLNATQCATNLCIVQILLRVAPKGCRSMAASLYTLTLTLSNCIMPMLGVQIYRALGADYRALLMFNGGLTAVRIFAWLLLLWRNRQAEAE